MNGTLRARATPVPRASGEGSGRDAPLAPDSGQNWREFAAHHRVAREAGDLAVRAIAVEDALALDVHDADRVGGVVEHGAEALALLRQLPPLDDAPHEQREHRKSDHGQQEIGRPDAREQGPPRLAQQPEAAEGDEERADREREGVMDPHPLGPSRPAVRQPGRHRHRDDDDHARHRAGAAQVDSIDRRGQPGDEGGPPALEEADEGDRDRAPVDEDALAGLDAGDHQDDRDGAPDQAQRDRPEGPAARIVGSEPAVGQGVEEDARDDDARRLEQVVIVHQLRPAAARPVGRGSSSRRNFPV